MRKRWILSVLVGATLAGNLAAQDPFLGEIRMFAGNFAPRGWALCDGQLLAVSQNAALFSILGTIYGGDGRTTFGLPDLRGRFPMHAGSGPGLSNRILGSKDGAESATLTAGQMPSHTHTVVLRADSTVGSSDRPDKALPARNASSTPVYGDTARVALSDSAAVAQPAGSGQPHKNMPPFQCINFIIALQGLFPSRN